MTSEALVSLLGMPKGTFISDIRRSDADMPGSFTIVVMHEDLDQVPEGGVVPRIDPIIDAGEWRWK